MARVIGSKVRGACLCIVCDDWSVFLNVLQENLEVWGSPNIAMVNHCCPLLAKGLHRHGGHNWSSFFGNGPILEL